MILHQHSVEPESFGPAMELSSQQTMIILPLLKDVMNRDSHDDSTEHRSIDGTSSSTSFDGFSSDMLGSTTASPHNSMRWDGDESNLNASIYSSNLPWSKSSTLNLENSRLEYLPKIINSKGIKAWYDEKDQRQETTEASVTEAEMIKERFAKLLLGEDLSGGGKGVSTALAVSNAITNLSASIFGELRQLEPLTKERKLLWQREMDRLLSVSDYIVEFVPLSKSLPDGTTMKVMDTKPRLDLHISLPALRKLDNMLIDALDSFCATEFWYADQSMSRSDTDEDPVQRRSERWWLPIPKVPPKGLSAECRKHLQHQRECINQILKAALAVNAQVLSEMGVPQLYSELLPKNGKSSLGEALYREISSEEFSASAMISSLDPNQEHKIVDLINCVEAAMHIWKKKVEAKQTQGDTMNGQIKKALLALPKDGLVGVERRQVLIERAESLLLLLRMKFRGLPQSVLDVNKIQYSKDVGQSILESYSRVLESLAYNIRSRIDDVIYADDMVKYGEPSPFLRCRMDNGSTLTSSLPSTFSTTVVSPAHSVSGWSRKAHAFEEACQFSCKAIPWLGSYKHWPNH